MIVSLGDLQTVHCTVQGSLTVIVLHNALLMQQPFFRTLGSLCGTLGIDFFRQFDEIAADDEADSGYDPWNSAGNPSETERFDSGSAYGDSGRYTENDLQKTGIFDRNSLRGHDR